MCSGRKDSQTHLTRLAAGNVHGERLSMFAIGKSGNSCCFKGVKSLSFQYGVKAKARYLQNFLKNGYGSSIGNLVQLKGILS